jgi:hypothetical protein
MEKHRCQDCGNCDVILFDVTYRNLPKGSFRDGLFCENCLKERKENKISEFNIFGRIEQETINERG